MAMLSIANIRTLLETDLSDAALNLVALSEWDDLIARYGDDGERTVTVVGGHGDLVLFTPANSVGEIKELSYQGSATEVVLEAGDFILLHGGRVLRRLGTGPNSAEAWSSVVQVKYTPVSRANLRNRVHVDLIKLVMAHNGVNEEWFGDYKSKFPTSYHTARERIMRQMAPNRGMILA